MKKVTQFFLSMAIMFAFGNVALMAQPSVAAPTPPARTAAKVISFFSDAYTNIASVNFNPNWGQSTVVSTIQVAGNSTLKYASLNYQGTEFPATNSLTMKKLHVDVWTSDATSFQITPISHGPKEKLITPTPLTLNQWNSYDIDLTQFTGVDFSDIFQFKVVGNGTIYIDNLYFYDNTATVDTQAPTGFTATKGAVTSEAVEFLLNATDDSGAVNYIITYGTTSVTVGGISGVQKSYSVTGLLGNTDYSFSIVAKDATGNTAASGPIVIAAKTAAGVPACPVPTRPAANVISIFSETYTSAAPAANYFPGWGQATVATLVNLAPGNAALKYNTLNYQGIELGVDVNAGASQYLHVNVYTENETSLQVTPISNSPVKEFLLPLAPLALNVWNSFNIPLASFTGVDKTKIFQFKFVGSGGKTVYIDNLYFHDGTTAVKNIYENKAVKVFPTIVSDYLNLTSDVEVKQIVIHNLTGQKVNSIVINSMEKNIDVSQLKSGNYFISIQLESGETVNSKFTKM